MINSKINNEWNGLCSHFLRVNDDLRSVSKTVNLLELLRTIFLLSSQIVVENLIFKLKLN
jgi:hypothetical protein